MHLHRFATGTRLAVAMVVGGAFASCDGCTENPCPSGFLRDRRIDRCVGVVADRELTKGEDSLDAEGLQDEAIPDSSDIDNSTDADVSAMPDDGDTPTPALDAETGDTEPSEAGGQARPNDGGAPDGGAFRTWQQVPGIARDIAVAANGDVWVVGSSEEKNGHSVHKWADDRWIRVVSDGAERIAVDPAGAPWIVSKTGTMLRRSSNTSGDAAWVQVPGCAIDLSIGANADVWSVQCDHLVSKWDGAAWQNGGLSDLSAARIAVAPDGTPWILDLGERVFRRTSPRLTTGRWEYLHGTGARDIAIASDGSASIVSDVVDNGGFIVKLLNEHGAWVPIDGSAAAQNIAAGARDIWITNAALGIFRYAR